MAFCLHAPTYNPAKSATLADYRLFDGKQHLPRNLVTLCGLRQTQRSQPSVPLTTPLK